jgi:hypothetical protein
VLSLMHKFLLLHNLTTPRSLLLLLLLLLLQAAAAELARLEASRARVVSRVHSLEGHLGRLVDEEATLLEQRTEGEECMCGCISACVAVVAGVERSSGKGAGVHCRVTVLSMLSGHTSGAAHRG